MSGPAAAQSLSITNYQFVSQSPVTATQWQVIYKADVLNSGAIPYAAVTAQVSTLNPFSVRTISGMDTLNFAPVPANSQVTSSNTFTILVDRTVPFNFNNLQWAFTTTPVAPIANAGQNQTAAVNSIVTLNGSASTNPSGIGTLTYSWAFVSRPPGSTTTLTNRFSVMPTFLVDLKGTYVVQLTVSNGASSSTANVTISTQNTPPVANAGPNQTVVIGATVTLTGAGSTDVNGDALTFKWTLTQVPAGSAATLTGANTVSPTFTADKTGTYQAQLIVNDGLADSQAAFVIITSTNVPPVANAGQNQRFMSVPVLVQLDGSGSTDINGLTLTYKWSLIALPQASAAVLSNPNIVNPTFTADVQGTYIAQLIVNDGTVDSQPSTVTITTNVILAPTANAGTAQMVTDGTLVTLHGTASDPQSLPLTYQWSFTMKPVGSAATLTNATSLTPTFVADLAGTYIVQLIANNGFLSSTPPSTVTISTSSVKPVANPGTAQNVRPGATVNLDGTGSGDSNQNPLTYSWTFISVPPSSTAALSGANTAKPSFVADLVGAYVVQLIVNDGFMNSDPSTVMITATSVPSITLAPNPLLVSNAANAQGTMTITLSSPAGANGLIVHLLSNDSTIAGVPATVSIGANGTTASFAVSGGNVGSTTITAAATGYTAATATVNVIMPSLMVAVDSTTIGLTHTVNGTVTINTPAPPTGVNVNLGSNPSGIVDVEPSSVKILAGSTSASFTVTGIAVGGATLTAGTPGYSTVSANLTVSSLGQISLPSTATTGPGQTVALQLSISPAAGSGGVTVQLSSNSANVTVPASVFIPQNATAPTTLPLATGVNFGSAVITAMATGYVSATETVKVAATLSFSPNTLTLPLTGTQNLNLTLSSPAPAGTVVNLSSADSTIASVPSTVSFATGATSASVPVTANKIGSTTIHASNSALADTTAMVTVATNTGSITLPSTLSVALGQSVPLTVTLSQPAQNAVTVTLSSNSSGATVSPNAVTIAAGASTPAVQPMVTGAGFTAATITASAAGYVSGTSQVTVTATLSFGSQSVMVQGGAVVNVALNLSGQAPAGTVVNLSSNSPSIASVPATITFPVGATSVNVPVTGVMSGSTTIHASALPSLQDTTTAVTVMTIGSISLQSGVTAPQGQSASLAVTLTTPAPSGGVTISLQSSNTSILTISPSTVFIDTNQTTPAAQPQVTGVAYGSATITASGLAYNAGSASVQVSGTLAFTPNTLSITGTTPQNLTLTLSSVAPAGGVTVNLKSDNTSIATVPATATIAAGATSGHVPVTGVATGMTTIHASLLPNLPDTTAAVTVNIPRDITLPANVTVAPGSTISYTVTLTNAPASPVFVNVVSGNSSIASLNTSSLLFQAGQTTGKLQLTGVALGSTTMTASANGLIGDTETVNVANTVTFTPSPIAITGNTTQNVTLTLSAPAPPAGLTVNLKSDDPTVATVPATVNFMPNGISASFTLTGVSATGGTTTIHASAPPTVLDTTVTVTVAPPGMIVLPSNVTLAPSQSQAFAITLGTAAPQGGVSVTLISSDPTTVSISPTSVVINGGQTQPAVQPQITALNLGNVTINATATGYLSASQPVKVAATINFNPNSANITGTATTNLTLNLSAPAPAGLVINLSSSPSGVVTVPATVTFATGATSVMVPVTGAGTGQTTVTASTSAANIASTTANITVAPAVPATISINGGATQSTMVGMAFGTALAVTVKDANSNVVANTPVVFTVVPGSAGQSGTFSNSTGTITVNTNASGVASAGIFTANHQPSSTAYTVSVTAGAAPAATFTLTNLAGAATHYTVSIASPQTQGTPFSFTVTALDSFGNTATGYAGTVHFTSSDSVATLPANATLTAGVGGFQATFNTTPTETITATDTVTSSIAGTSSAITVNPGQASMATHFSVTGAPGNIGAGVQFTVTVTAQTSTNSTATTYAGTVHLTSTDGNAVLQGPMTLTNGVGMFTVTLKSVGGQTVTATDGSINGVTGTITVVPGVVASFVVTAPSTATAGVAFSTLSVTAKDSSGNVATNYAGMVHFTSSDGAASLPANATLTSGVRTFSATLNTAGNQTITATDTGSAATGTSGGISVTRPATHFSVSAGSSAMAGVPISFTVTALDSIGATVTNYAGTVHFTSNDPNGATLPANSTLSSGVGTFMATLKKAQSGTTITATDTVNGSITGTSGAITVSMGSAGIVSVVAGDQQSAQLGQAFPQALVALVTDLGGNPISGAFVTFTANAGGSGASGTFAGSQTVSHLTDATGQTSAALTANSVKGTFTVSAAVNGASSATFNLTNVNAVTLSNVSVGQNLQATMTVTLPQTSGTASMITLTSSDPSKVLLYNGTNTAPAAQTTITINAGDPNGLVYVQGQGGGTGTVTVTATLTGFDNGTATVTVTNSGFVLSQQSGNGIGVSFTTGTQATLLVQSAQLDAAGNFIQIQPVAIGASVQLTSSLMSVGTVTSPVTFAAGDNAETATFTPVNSGGPTTITAVSPGNGYFASPTIGCPSSCIPANQVNITVPPPGITIPNVSVGNLLAASAFVTLSQPAPSPSGMSITISTSDPHLQLSNTLGGAGSSSIMVTASAGQLASATFYINGLASTGSASYSATSNFGSAMGTVSFTPSTIVIAGPSTTIGAGITTTPTAGPSNVYLFSYQLNGGSLGSQQPLSGAQNVTVTQQVNVGTSGTFSSPVSFSAGTSAVQTTFTPAGTESGSLIVTEPTGFSSAPSGDQSISLTVNTPGISVAQNTIGVNLQVQGSLSLGQLAPSGGVIVNLTATGGLLLSNSATTAGTSTLQVMVMQGTNTGLFYVQGGSAAAGSSPTITAQASGYNNSPASVQTIVGSAAFVFGQGFGQSALVPVSVSSGSTANLILFMTVLDVNGKPYDHQALAGGLTMNITVNNTNTGAGTIAPTNPVTITGGTDGVNLTFSATGASGSTTQISADGGASPPVTVNVTN